MSWDGSQEEYRPEETDPFCFLDIRDVLFPYVNMQPWSFVDFCGPGLLEKQYRSGKCTDADARNVLAALQAAAKLRQDGGERALMNITAMLLLTAKHFPAACREPAGRDVFLQTYLRTLTSGKPRNALLNCWRRLSGRDRDISCCARMIFSLRGKELKHCLAALAEGGSLCASADALYPNTVTELREMLRWVRVVPSPFRSGISGFARAVLALSPDARLLQKLFQDGPLTAEPKEAVLRAAHVRMRPLILTASFTEPAETYDPLRIGTAFLHDNGLTGTAWAQSAERLFSGPMSEKDCLMYLCDPGMFDARWSKRPCPGFPELDSGCLQNHLLSAENPDALRAWLRLHPEAAGSETQASLIPGGAMSCFCGPPLAIAAAAGRVENVRTLLAENPYPDVCCGAMLDDECVPCTPFLLALWFAREETARALLAAGAVCALDQGPAFRFFRAMPPEGRALAARLPGIGYECAAAREAGETGSC